jgi:hypothetical protein
MSLAEMETYWQSKGYFQGWNDRAWAIIALLESKNKYLYDDEREYVIALIKGEQPVSVNPDIAAVSENPNKGEKS